LVRSRSIATGWILTGANQELSGTPIQGRGFMNSYKEPLHVKAVRPWVLLGADTSYLINHSVVSAVPVCWLCLSLLHLSSCFWLPSGPENSFRLLHSHVFASYTLVKVMLEGLS
jgi:hypothetical protein